MNDRKTSPTGIMLVSIQMLADELGDMGWDFQWSGEETSPRFSGYLIYSGQTDLKKDTLYLLPEGGSAGFPRNRFGYVTQEDLPGAAPHIRCLNQPFSQILNGIIRVFRRYQEFEMQLNRILTDGGSLTDLCHVGSAFFGNPIYIHDDMFTVIALSGRVEGMLKFEYNEHKGKLYIPLWLINDFKFDHEYQHTMELRQAGLWDNNHYPYNIRSLFYNLWDGAEYLGRLMINELRSPLLPSHFQSVEYLAEYAMMLMRRDGLSQNHVYRDFEDTFIDLLTGVPADPRDLRTMLSILDWHESDRYLCLKLQDQNLRGSIHPDTALSNELANVLSGFSCFHYQKRLCIVVNLTLSRGDPGTIRRSLAPYIRDSLMFGGISNPVEGIYAIAQAFRQTDIVLDYITNRDSSQWLLPFSACALSYIRACATRELPPEVLAEPMLLTLLRFDRENGTSYYDTLRTFLLNERSIPKTAEALIIHRTTLTYRLRKIEELVRLNLDDDEQRQYLLFSFFILEGIREPEAKDLRRS